MLSILFGTQDQLTQPERIGASVRSIYDRARENPRQATVHPAFIAEPLGNVMLGRAYIAIVLALLVLVSPAAGQTQNSWAAQQTQSQAQTQPQTPWSTASPVRHPAPPGYAIQPLDRILPTIRSSRPGRFFDADGPFPDAAGGWHYRIKWLTPNGRIVWLDADARTGRVLGPFRGYAPVMALPPSGLRYYPFVPGPRGFRGRGGWRPWGWGGGWGPGGRRR
jgi:uncharacterized membrane protein YkoI